MLLSAVIVIGAFALILAITDWSYVRLHPVAAHEEDFGYGLVMAGTFLGCALVAMPVGGLIAWRIKKAIARKVNEHNHS